ncbi:MAG: site-specific integrase [Candidatus Thermoplasmatota archaeon]|nr:site-specific integrase [Candidatus Thermoplasmatota archaeon]
MGRYPFRALLPKYFDAIAPYRAKSTLANEKRILRRISLIVDPEESLPDGYACAPRKIREPEVSRFIEKMKELRLKPSTQKKYLQYLDNFLVWCGNPIIGKMRQLRHVNFPNEVEDEIVCLSNGDLDALVSAAYDIGGWNGSICKLMVSIYPSTGLRPSELRTLRLGDVDFVNSEIRVSCPKGENVYGKHRTVPILEHIRPAIEEFLGAREEYLVSHGVNEYEALVPYCTSRGTTRYYTQAEWAKVKALLEEKSMVQFKLKDFRSTFCQQSIDKGAKLSSVSKIMGHSNSATTEKFYGRIKDKAACDDIQRAWKEAQAQQSVTKCVVPSN